MKNLLALWLSLLLLSGLGMAQTPNMPLGKNLVGYRGNPVEWPVTLNLVDSLAPVSVRAFYGKNDRPLDTNWQPTLTRSGRVVTIHWSGTQTGSAMPAESWYELKVGNLIQLAGSLSLSKTPLATAPGSLTLTQYVVVPADAIGGGSLSGNRTKFFTLENAPNGMTLTHNVGSRLVASECYWSDTGAVDAIWRIEPLDDNRVILRGPPSELFSGTVVLTIYQKLTN